MIDHFGIKVKDLEASKLFYQQALEPLGYKLAFEIPQAVSFAEHKQLQLEIFGWERESSLRFTLLFWQKTMSRFKLVMRLV